MTRTLRARRGMSLVEVLVMIAVMGIALNMTARLFVGAMRLGALNTETIDRATALVQFESDIVDALRAGEAVLPEAGPYHSDATHVVLRTRANDGAPRVIVLGPLDDPERVALAEFTPSGAQFALQRLVHYAIPVGECHFTYDAAAPANARCVTLHYRARPWDGRHAPPQLHEIVSTLRGVGGTQP